MALVSVVLVLGFIRVTRYWEYQGYSSIRVIMGIRVIVVIRVMAV